MEQKETKLSTYLGFSIKNKTMIFGLDNILSCRKHLYVIVVGDNLTDKNMGKVLTFAKCKNCTVVQVMQNFGDLICRPTCKLAAVFDKNLAKAIVANTQTIYKGEI